MITTLIIVGSYLIALIVVCAGAYNQYMTEKEISEWIKNEKEKKQ